MKTKALFGILTVSLALAGQIQAQSFLTNGLVAYYPLNGNGQDLSPHNDNGIVSNTIPATDRFGNMGKALYFNATNHSAVIPAGTFLPVGTSQRTISLWFIADNISSGPFREEILIGYGDYSSTATGAVFTVSLSSNGGLLMNGNWSGAGTWLYPLFDNNWHHVVYTLAENVLSGYLDGGLVTWEQSSSSNVVFETVNANYGIGSSAGRYFDGGIVVCDRNSQAKSTFLGSVAAGIGSEEPLHPHHQVGLGRFDDQLKGVAQQAIPL